MLLTCVLAVLAGASALFAQSDSHVLTREWKQFEQAEKDDRPQKAAAILGEIREEAMKRHLPVDFYDAATRYVEVVARRDWKQRDTLNKELEQLVARFDEPLVTFLWMKNQRYTYGKELDQFVSEHAEGLSGYHPGLYRGLEYYLDGGLKPFIRNDREYAYWTFFSDSLAREVAGVYPNEAIWKYLSLDRRYFSEQEREQEWAAWQELAGQYAGQAFGVYPRARLLQLRFDQLNREKAGTEAFRQLYQDAEALEKERKSYQGEDKTLLNGCKIPSSLMESLTDPYLAIRFVDKQAYVFFRNLPGADVTLQEGEKLIRNWKLVNEKRSFYVMDSLKIELPSLPDGDYQIKARHGEENALLDYEQYQLSVATRMDSRGTCVYVTDYESGVPLHTVTLRLLKNGKEIATTTLKLDGFTPLPNAFARHLSDSKGSLQLLAESGARRSRAVHLFGNPYTRQNNDFARCHFYKDRGAYNPGDTLQFKAVLFQGDPAHGLKTVSGRKVKVCLHDNADEVVESLELTTNAWGSVSGSFVIPKGHRGGRWELEAVGLGSDWLRVDEFVLPSFDLSFNPVDSLYLVGADVPVSGRLISYSGHVLRKSAVLVTVKRGVYTVLEEQVPVREDNSFQTRFHAEESGYYEIEVTVTDASGETHGFRESRYVAEKVRVEADVKNKADAQLTPGDGEYSWRRNQVTVTENTLSLVLLAKDGDDHPVPYRLPYELCTSDGKRIAGGETASGESFTLSLPGSGKYLLKSLDYTLTVFCLPSHEKALTKEVKRVFLPGSTTLASGKPISARLGSTEGDAWVVMTLYGENRQVLVHRILRVKDGALETLSLPYKESYPDAVRLQLFYFIRGIAVEYNSEYRREKDKYTLPLTFTRFQDKAYPGAQYTFSLKTSPDAEVLVAAWDKSMDAVETNDWPTVHLRDFSVDPVSISRTCGRVGGSFGFFLRGNAVAKSAAVQNVSADRISAEEAVPFQLVEAKPTFGLMADVAIREKFASALTFQPHLYPEKDGTLHFQFRTSDKLSTYYVRAYAHDIQMHNALVQDEMVVSLPVKVDILAPRYLYAGDRYEAVVTVSSISDEAVSGTLFLRAGDHVQSVPVTVQPGETVSHSFPVSTEEDTLPSAFARTGSRSDAEGRVSSSVTLTAAFKADGFSDAVRVKVPVYPAAQQLTEFHSAVLLAGMDRDALIQTLRSRFVNVSGDQAVLREISVLDMVKDVLSQHVKPYINDVLSLSEAWYVSQLLEGDTLSVAFARTGLRSDATESVSSTEDDELLKKIMACYNADGGFSWFEGMPSNPVITAVLLERFAKLRSRGIQVPDLAASVRYLDKVQFGERRPSYWCYLSNEQYVYVRSMYADVAFEGKAPSKELKKILTPSKKQGRGLNGQILAKARRMLTLRNLMESEKGLALAKAWGFTLGTKFRLRASYKADLASLLEYAVEHRDGGQYFPNAVMPWRGLMESEAYAHALLCDLLKKESPAVADGIRLWLMLQKETQKWDADPAFVDAVMTILDGSESVLNTRVLALSASYEAPFREIKASGNGFRITRRLFRNGVELHPGEVLNVGDKITVRYEIRSDENRSFVKISAGREACLAPVKQLSGLYSYSGYREVKASATEYFFEHFAEETTTLTEEFYMVSSGSVFQAPVVVVESLYAPHYRANSACGEPMVAERKR